MNEKETLIFSAMRKDLIERFYLKNDAGHQIDHIDKVYENMLAINDKLGLNLDIRLIGITAYYHDIFTYLDRDQHHNLAADYVINSKDDKFLQAFTKEDRLTASLGIREHRSSGSCEYSNKYSLAIQIGDKGAPVLNNFIKRSFKYHIDKVSTEEAIVEVIHHMHEKFGVKGYGFKCKYYRDFYAREIRTFQKEVKELTVEGLKQILREDDLI